MHFEVGLVCILYFGRQQYSACMAVTGRGSEQRLSHGSLHTYAADSCVSAYGNVKSDPLVALRQNRDGVGVQVHLFRIAMRKGSKVARLCREADRVNHILQDDAIHRLPAVQMDGRLHMSRVWLNSVSAPGPHLTHDIGACVFSDKVNLKAHTEGYYDNSLLSRIRNKHSIPASAE